MKHCAREADRKERADSSAVGALIGDCARELSPQFIVQMTAKFANPQKSLFEESLAEVATAYKAGNPSHVLEQDVITNLQRREACGQTGKDAFAGALTDALARRRDSQLRAMKGHWLKEAGGGAAAAVDAAERSLEKLPITELASQILEGKINRKSLGCSGTQVNLDEDLREGASDDSD